ncbi:MAG TPA: hypothetical protein VNV87_18405 [Acidimicrobiales bacterium]|jgi:hypothetical protein|nr:hypothetical protein [Acidimicrobiales bacterium]
MIPPTVKRVATSRLLIGVVLCAALTLAAFYSSSASASKPLPTGGSPPTTTQPTAASVTTRVISDYRTMWADLVAAARTSNYQSTLLPRHATGAALTLLVQGLAKDRVLGIVTKGQPVLQPSVSSLTPAANPTKASITDCFDNTHWIEYKTNGTLQKNAPGGRRSTTAKLVRIGGTWKVTELTIRATGTC